MPGISVWVHSLSGEKEFSSFSSLLFLAVVIDLRFPSWRPPVCCKYWWSGVGDV